jgi:hypothetical protein
MKQKKSKQEHQKKKQDGVHKLQQLHHIVDPEERKLQRRRDYNHRGLQSDHSPET